MGSRRPRKDVVARAMKATGLSHVRIIRAAYRDDNVISIDAIEELCRLYVRGQRMPKKVRDFAKKLLEERQKEEE